MNAHAHSELHTQMQSPLAVSHAKALARPSEKARRPRTYGQTIRTVIGPSRRTKLSTALTDEDKEHAERGKNKEAMDRNPPLKMRRILDGVEAQPSSHGIASPLIPEFDENGHSNDRVVFTNQTPARDPQKYRAYTSEDQGIVDADLPRYPGVLLGSPAQMRKMADTPSQTSTSSTIQVLAASTQSIKRAVNLMVRPEATAAAEVVNAIDSAVSKEDVAMNEPDEFRRVQMVFPSDDEAEPAILGKVAAHNTQHLQHETFMNSKAYTGVNPITLKADDRKKTMVVLFSTKSRVPQKEKIIDIFRSLGGEIVKVIDNATMYCVPRYSPLAKTPNLLNAVVNGKDVIYDSWVTHSSRAGKLLSIAVFIPHDTVLELHWQFNLKDAVARGKQGLSNILASYTVTTPFTLRSSGTDMSRFT